MHCVRRQRGRQSGGVTQTSVNVEVADVAAATAASVKHTQEQSATDGHVPQSGTHAILLLSMLVVASAWDRVIGRAHSFPPATEFRAEPRNLPVAAKFLHLHRIVRSLIE